MADHIKTIAVIGAGTMGNGIAHVSAQSGRDVILIDLDDGRLQSALATISKNLNRQVSKGRLDQGAADDTLQRIVTSTSMNAAADADIVIEAATENRDLKEKIFADIDAIAKSGAILATNTSSISIDRLASVTRRPESVIGMHFMNPVPLMELVEVIVGARTTPKTHETILALAQDMGKSPVTVNDAPGFIANRILMPMINEAILCLEAGIAEKEAIDQIMVMGMSHPMGPLTLADLIGLDTCLAIIQVLHHNLDDDKYKPAALLESMVADGKLGRKSGRGFYDY